MPLRVPLRIDAVLVTSGNAAPAIAGLAVPVLAVGDATAERARAAGMVDVTSANGTADDLFSLATTRCAPRAHLLLPSGQGQGYALARRLRGAGFRVHRRSVYEARPVSRLPEAACQALARGRLRAALFLSSETARAFVQLLPAEDVPHVAGIEALAISRKTADALAPLPWRRVRVSVGPTLDHVLALL